MNDYRINWSVTVNGTHYSGTVDVSDQTMSPSLARQYAVADLHEHHGTMPVSVGNIEVEWSKR
jgi:hypothetical protein